MERRGHRCSAEGFASSSSRLHLGPNNGVRIPHLSGGHERGVSVKKNPRLPIVYSHNFPILERTRDKEEGFVFCMMTMLLMMTDLKEMKLKLVHLHHGVLYYGYRYSY
jgi:hypothetical protein